MAAGVSEAGCLGVPLMSDRLIERIRAKLLAGEIPSRRPLKVWAGSSAGTECVACGGQIAIGTPEIEVDCADERTRFYHARCYNIVAAIRARDGD